MHLTKLGKERIAEFGATILNNPYILHEPTQKQAAFLLQSDIKTGFYGGAARGGKSDALLMGALQYVTEPDYAALLFRRTFKQLGLEDAIMARAEQWLSNTNAKWEAQDKRWRFPSGATLAFGYLDTERDKYRYQSAAYQYIGFDELSQFTESQYTYLFSRLTRLEGSEIPLRMRAASNPGDIGHEWVKARFITPTRAELLTRNRFFIPAYLEDNPHVDQEAYEESLNELDPVTREQLRHGNWDIALEGNMFKRYWFKVQDAVPYSQYARVRYWDTAGTKDGGDWTVGCLMAQTIDGMYCIENIIRVQEIPGDVEKLVLQTAKLDSSNVAIRMEQEPADAGKKVIADYALKLKGYDFRGVPSTGSKVTRAKPFSSAASNNLVTILSADWNNDLLTELTAFPEGVNDDIVDACSCAYTHLSLSAPRPSHAIPIADIAITSDAFAP